jgi:nicotinate-nucleotide adenylyltransferase
MCTAALADLPDALQEKVSVLDLEVNRSGPTFTIDTINQLRMVYPRDSFTIILGSDAAAKFDEWYRAEALKKIVDILVVKRPGSISQISQSGQQKSGFTEVEINAIDLSATMVREAIAKRADLAPMLSPSVRTYIKENGLYGSK